MRMGLSQFSPSHAAAEQVEIPPFPCLAYVRFFLLFLARSSSPQSALHYYAAYTAPPIVGGSKAIKTGAYAVPEGSEWWMGLEESSIQPGDRGGQRFVLPDLHHCCASCSPTIATAAAVHVVVRSPNAVISLPPWSRSLACLHVVVVMACGTHCVHDVHYMIPLIAGRIARCCC